MRYHSIFDNPILTTMIKSLLVNLLYPFPANRLTSREALGHPWFLREAELVRLFNESLAAAAVNDVIVNIEETKHAEATLPVPPQLQSDLP